MATYPEVWVWFPALPDFLGSSGSGMGSTQPREYNWGATWKKSSGSSLETEITAIGICHTDHATLLYPQNLVLTLPTSGGRLISIVHSRTKAIELLLLFEIKMFIYHIGINFGSFFDDQRLSAIRLTYHYEMMTFIVQSKVCWYGTTCL
jgi:hypothetical protein